MQGVRLEYQRGSLKDFVEVVLDKEYAEKATKDPEFATRIIEAVLASRSGNQTADATLRVESTTNGTVLVEAPTTSEAIEAPVIDQSKPVIQAKLTPENPEQLKSVRQEGTGIHTPGVSSNRKAEPELIVLDSDSDSGDETGDVDLEKPASAEHLSSNHEEHNYAGKSRKGTANLQGENSQAPAICSSYLPARDVRNIKGSVHKGENINMPLNSKKRGVEQIVGTLVGKFENSTGVSYNMGKAEVAPSSNETDAGPSCQENDQHPRPKSRWSESATHALIDILIDMLTKKNQWLNMDRFKEASLEMKKRGFNKSFQDCRLKLKGLKRSFKPLSKKKRKSSTTFWEFQAKMEILMQKLRLTNMYPYPLSIQSEKALVPENCRDGSADCKEAPQVEQANDRIPKPIGEPKWDDKSVTYLLSLYSTMASQSTDGRLVPNVWEDIARMMSRSGVSATASQCSSKANYLMRKYEELCVRRVSETLPHCDQVLYEQLSAVFVTNPIPLESSANDVEMQENDIEIHGSNFESREGQVKWSDKSVRYLLRLYSTKGDQLTDGKLAPCAWEDIARIMTRSGFSVTADQCSSKADDLIRICKDLAKSRTIQPLPPREQVLYQQLSAIFGKSQNLEPEMPVECSKTTSSPRTFRIKGASFEEQMKCYLATRLARQEEHERARRLLHKEQMETKQKLISAFSEFLKRH